MGEWLLIFMLWGYREPSITFARFATETACRRAGEEAEKLSPPDVFKRGLKWSCIKPSTAR